MGTHSNLINPVFQATIRQNCLFPFLDKDQNLEQANVLGVLKRHFMSCSHCQELCQLAVLASDWLFRIHSCAANQKLACVLTQLLTMTTTHFPSLEVTWPRHYHAAQETVQNRGIRFGTRFQAVHRFQVC